MVCDKKTESQLGSFFSEQMPLIAHLPITSRNIAYQFTNKIKPLHEINGQPSAYDNRRPMSYLVGMEDDEGVENEIIETITPENTFLSSFFNNRCSLFLFSLLVPVILIRLYENYRRV